MNIDLEPHVRTFVASGVAGPVETGASAPLPKTTVEIATISPYRIAFGCSLEPAAATQDAQGSAASPEDRGARVR